MNFQARLVLTFLLMFLVVVITSLLFPPPIPDEAISADSATGAEVVTETEPSTVPVPTMPEIAPSPSEVPETVEAEALPEEKRVVVSSPLYRFEFSNYGARLHAAEMSQFEALNHDGLVDLIPDGAEGYLGQKLVVGSDTLDLSRVPFTVEPEDGLALEAGADAQILRFTYQHPTNSFRFETEYEFSPDEYTIRVRGRASGVDRPQLLTDLGDGLAFAEADSAMEAREMGYVYNHVQEGIDETLTSKAERMIVEGPLLWGALRNKFFLLAILAGESNEAVTEESYLGGLVVEVDTLVYRSFWGRENSRAVGFQVTAAQVVGAEGDFAYRLFFGPQDFEMLSAIGWDMQNVNPYGWSFFQVILKPFVSLITKILIWVHSNLNLGYGWVLILFGVGMRIVLFPLNQKAMKSQLKNMAVQPLMKEIQEKYKDNPEKLTKEMKKLYTEHGFNPLGGCLPMLLPWPMLVAFFFVFQSTIELRGVPFLWLPDLSTKDPTFVLPFFLGASMFLMMYVSHKSMDTPNPQMKMMMYMMPPFMIFIFMNLASGLNLYYATANIATIPQQMYIAKQRKKMQGMKPLGRSPPSPSR